METVISLPHVGESVTEGVIGKWLKNTGDHFEKYEPLVEVVTDKVTMEVPAPFDGILTEILAAEGQTLPMGAPIAKAETEGMSDHKADTLSAEPPPKPENSPSIISTSVSSPQETAIRARIGTFTEGTWGGPTGGLPEEEEEETHPSATHSVPQTTPSQPTQQTPVISSTTTKSEDQAIRSSSVVSRLAQEHGVDLSQLKGTGLGDRITKKDIIKAIEFREPGGVTGQVTVTTPISLTTQQDAPPQIAPDEEAVALSPLRLTIANNMVRSAQEIPRAWMTMEVDVTNMVLRRNEVKKEFRAREGVPLTYLPFVIKVVVEALRECPDVNSRWGVDKIIRRKRISIGIAVATAQGLLVPVLHDADEYSISELANAAYVLIKKAGAGTLGLEDVQGGTFTVNNTGALGTIFTVPIINYPQAAIITTEAIVKRPIVLDSDIISVRHMMNICISFDHRILDGQGAGSFLSRVKKGIEAIGPTTPV
jgi:2-oxoisovalerate dehydrogenase E2 component (dihydrolipoyl transacylase)